MPVTGAFILPHPPIILPEVGRGEERKIQKTIDSFREIAGRIRDLKPETIVLTSPHSILYADYFHISPGEGARGTFGQFRAPDVVISAAYDTEFVLALERRAAAVQIPAGTLGERDPALDHGTMIPLAFINEVYTDYKLVRLGLSGLPLADHYRLGLCIAEVADALCRRVVFVASGDLSHKVKAEGPYGYAPEGVEFDREITKAMAEGDFLRFLTFSPELTEKAAECGLRSFVIMAGAMDGRSVQAELLSYEGTFGVGYGAASFFPGEADESRRFLEKYLRTEQDRLRKVRESEDAFVRLARYSAEHYVTTGKRAALPEGLPPELTGERAGVFVSLKKHGSLRGCIGTISPVMDSIAEEILRNAVSACAEDPRFPPVRPDELPELVVSVDVLSPPEPISSPDKLDVKRCGVIVSSGIRRGLLLPNLEGVDTVGQQIGIALQKADIRPDESYRMERFEVVRHT